MKAIINQVKNLKNVTTCIQLMYSSRNGSSRPEVFCKKSVLRNFTKFMGKHLCQSLFFNKVAGLRHATLLKKGRWHRCFPVNFVKFLRTPFFMEQLWWLLLKKKNRLTKKRRKCQCSETLVNNLVDVIVENNKY